MDLIKEEIRFEELSMKSFLTTPLDLAIISQLNEVLGFTQENIIAGTDTIRKPIK